MDNFVDQKRVEWNIQVLQELFFGKFQKPWVHEKKDELLSCHWMSVFLAQPSVNTLTIGSIHCVLNVNSLYRNIGLGTTSRYV